MTTSKNGAVKYGGFRILREVDQDSLGTLYEAEHPRLQQKVALRTIGATAARDVTHSRRFLLELRSYVSLDHPAIPRLYELAYNGSGPYLVTEIIPGKTLDDMLTDSTQREPRGVIELLEPIASALDYAHSRATVHRDVKPANILLADDGRTMLTGFGLGTIASFSNGPGAAGPMAPDYVAPERLVGREVDSRADVYSLAARRPATAGELLQGLSDSLDPPPPKEEQVHWLHPHMHRGSMVVSGLLVLVVGVAGITWFLDGEGLSLLMRLSHLVGGR